MTTKRWLGVLGFTIFGILLFASWLLPGQAGFWYELDKSVFFFFNHLIGQSQALLYLVAFTNLRPFDAVAFLFMLGIFYHYYRLQDAKGRRWMLCGPNCPASPLFVRLMVPWSARIRTA